VRDNTSETALPLGERPLYVLDGPVFNSGVADSSRDLLAATGWTGSAYTEPRAAAPFSVLDVMYRATQFAAGADPTVSIDPLDVFWSVNNTPAVGSIELGEIGTSFYQRDARSLFLLGDAALDTEEFDTHVVAHEWGHHFEEVLSRADSPGGSHTLDARLDARLAFGEGWGNAVGAMVMDDPVYFDTFVADSFGFSLESYDTAGMAGWYNEASVQSILWDLYDSAADDGDTLSLGFGPIYDILTGSQRTTPAVTSVFSFLEGLKTARPADAAAIDALVSDENLDAIDNIWGDGETNDPGVTDLTPIHAELFVGGGPVNVCTTREFDGGDGNRLGIFRYLRFTVGTAGNYRIAVTTTNPPATAGQFSDPDFFVLDEGQLVLEPDLYLTGAANSESVDLIALPAGTYVIELLEAGFPNVYGYFSSSDPLSQTEMCFDVSLTQI
jgi:hypothetical protein